MYLLTQNKQGISALQLSRDLGVNDNTAWSLKHKLAQVLFERQQGKTLTGRVEMDAAYLGGERAGIRGRGSPNKGPLKAAVATREGRPGYLPMRRIEGFSRRALALRHHQSGRAHAGAQRWPVRLRRHRPGRPSPRGPHHRQRPAGGPASELPLGEHRAR